MHKTKPLIIIGAGGHGRAVLDAARSSNHNVLAFVDEKLAGKKVLGVDVVATANEFLEIRNLQFFVAIGDNYRRQQIATRTKLDLPDASEAIIIHETAYVSPFSSIEGGCVIMAKVVVGANCRIERGCILNTGSQVDHDGYLKEYSSLGPAACLGGAVTLGTRSVVALGSSIKHGLEIGNDTIISAHAYLHQSVPDGVVYAGVPARKIKERMIGEPYL